MWWLVLVWSLIGGSGAGGTEVRFSVIAPADLQHAQSLPLLRPIVELAVLRIADPKTGLLPGSRINLTMSDSKCSSTHGPLKAFELHNTTGKSYNYFFVRAMPEESARCYKNKKYITFFFF
jgi:hypothetical protein